MNKTDEKRITSELAQIAKLRANLEDSIQETSKAIESYNEMAEALRATLHDIQSEAEDKHDGKSDKWKESDAGENSQNLIDAIGDMIGSIVDADNINIDDVAPTDYIESWENILLD